MPKKVIRKAQEIEQLEDLFLDLARKGDHLRLNELFEDIAVAARQLLLKDTDFLLILLSHNHIDCFIDFLERADDNIKKQLFLNDKSGIFLAAVKTRRIELLHRLWENCPENLRQGMLRGINVDYRAFIDEVTVNHIEGIKTLWDMCAPYHQQSMLRSCNYLPLYRAASAGQHETFKWLWRVMDDENKKAYLSKCKTPFIELVLASDLEFIEWIWNQHNREQQDKLLNKITFDIYTHLYHKRCKGLIITWLWKHTPYDQQVNIKQQAHNTHIAPHIPLTTADLICRMYNEIVAQNSLGRFVVNPILRKENIHIPNPNKKLLNESNLFAEVPLKVFSDDYHLHYITRPEITTITLLHFAARCGDLTLVEYLVEEHHLPVDFAIGPNHTPLHAAIIGGQADVARWLLANGAKPDFGNEIKTLILNDMESIYIHAKKTDLNDFLATVIETEGLDFDNEKDHAAIAERLIKMFEHIIHPQTLVEIANGIGIGLEGQGTHDKLSALRYRNLNMTAMFKKMGYRETNDSEQIAKALFECAKSRARFVDSPEEVAHIKNLFDRDISRKKSPEERAQRLKDFQAQRDEMQQQKEQQRKAYFGQD